MTNADRVRNMTNEELAGIIMCPYDTAGDEIMPCIDPDKSTVKQCCKCVREWLSKDVPEPKPEPIWKKAFMNTFLGGRR